MRGGDVGGGPGGGGDGGGAGGGDGPGLRVKENASRLGGGMPNVVSQGHPLAFWLGSVVSGSAVNPWTTFARRGTRPSRVRVAIVAHMPG